MLKPHEHEGDDSHRDLKRVRFTHKQFDKRADMELTDDTVAKRANFLTHHHRVLQVTRMRRIGMIHPVKSRSLRREEALQRNLEWMLMWKSVPLRRSQTPSWNSIEHWTRQTGRYIACWKKCHLSLRQSPKQPNSSASETSESTLRCTRTKPTPRSSEPSRC